MSSLTKKALLAWLLCFAASPAISGECIARDSFRIDGRPGQPAIADGIAYVGSSTNALHAIDLSTGELIWQAPANGPVFHAPAVHGELVLFGSQDGKLRGVERDTGALRWEFAAGNVDWDVRDIFINGTPTIVDGVAYFSSEDFNVYAVDVETGRERWRHTLGEEPQAWHLPIVDGTAYIGAWDGHLYAIDIDSGERVWRSSTDDTGRASLPDQVPFVTVVPIVDDESVYFTDWSGNLFAVDRESGRQQWRFDAGAVNGRHVGSRSFMAQHDDVLFYSTVEDRHLLGVDRRSGREVWRQATTGIPYGPATLGDGIAMYLELIPGEADVAPAMHMRMLDLATRQLLWSADDVGGPPNVSGSLVYFVATDGRIRGRSLRNGRPAPACAAKG